jgi:hypothetical protein
VPAAGEPAALLLSGVQVDELDEEHYALLETNDVTPRRHIRRLFLTWQSMSRTSP